MSVEMTPLSGGSVSGAYLDVPGARTLGATLPQLTALLAKTNDELAVLLLAASLDLDAAMPYQGVRYEADQAREFPRYQRAVDRTQIHTPSETLGGAVGIWDWDDPSGAAVVPDRVKIACLYQAASLLDPSFQRRLDAIRGGLASQSIGSMSESYLKPTDLPGGLSGGGLCDRAQRYMNKYRLRSAPLL